jgi:hypothetical protein
MADEESFDIYGDDEAASPSSPSQSGPKKRLRRERSSSAPPLINNAEEEEDGSSTPRGKKVKEEELEDEEDVDPFREYDDDVSTHMPVIFWLWLQRANRWDEKRCTVKLIYSITMERHYHPVKLHKALSSRERHLFRINHMLQLHYTSAIFTG